MEQIERQQRRLSTVSATSDALKANRMALYGRGAETYAMEAEHWGTSYGLNQNNMPRLESQLRENIA